MGSGKSTLNKKQSIAQSFPEQVSAYFRETAYEALNRIASAHGLSLNDALHRVVAVSNTVLTYMKSDQDPEWLLVLEKDGGREECFPHAASFGPDASQSAGSQLDGSEVQMSIEFTKASYEALERVAEKYNVSHPEAIRRSIDLVNFLMNKEKEGWNVILEKVDGTATSPVLAFFKFT